MEGKESGFRSQESIWTEDGGSGGHGREGTGRGDKPDIIRRNRQTNKQTKVSRKQTKLCADAQRTQQRNN